MCELQVLVELSREKENKVLITFTGVVHWMSCFLWSVFFSQNPIHFVLPSCV